MPLKPIEWSEINTALGPPLWPFVVAGKIPRGLFQLTSNHPLGSYSKVYKIDNRTIFSSWSGGGGGAAQTGGGATGAASSSTGSAAGTDGKPSASTQELALGSRSLSANPYRIPPNTTLLNLYMDLNATFSLFPRSKFNAALCSLMWVSTSWGPISQYTTHRGPTLQNRHRRRLGQGCCLALSLIRQTQASGLDLFWSGNASARPTTTWMSNGPGPQVRPHRRQMDPRVVHQALLTSCG